MNGDRKIDVEETTRRVLEKALSDKFTSIPYIDKFCKKMRNEKTCEAAAIAIRVEVAYLQS